MSSLLSNSQYISARSLSTERIDNYSRPHKTVLIFGYFGVGKTSMISKYNVSFGFIFSINFITIFHLFSTIFHKQPQICYKIKI